MAGKEELAALWQDHAEYILKVCLDLQIGDLGFRTTFSCLSADLQFLSEDRNEGSKPAATCDKDLRASETFTASQAVTIAPGCPSEQDGSALLRKMP